MIPNVLPVEIRSTSDDLSITFLRQVSEIEQNIVVESLRRSIRTHSQHVNLDLRELGQPTTETMTVIHRICRIAEQGRIQVICKTSVESVSTEMAALHIRGNLQIEFHEHAAVPQPKLNFLSRRKRRTRQSMM